MKNYLYLDLIHHRPKRFHPMTIIDHIQIQFNLDHLINTNSYLRIMTPVAAKFTSPGVSPKRCKHKTQKPYMAAGGAVATLAVAKAKNTEIYTAVGGVVATPAAAKAKTFPLRAESWPLRPQPKPTFSAAAAAKFVAAAVLSVLCFSLP